MLRSSVYCIVSVYTSYNIVLFRMLSLELLANRPLEFAESRGCTKLSMQYEAEIGCYFNLNTPLRSTVGCAFYAV